MPLLFLRTDKACLRGWKYFMIERKEQTDAVRIKGGRGCGTKDTAVFFGGGT